MNRPLRKLVAWITLAQVGLVGGLATGLHGLLGCEHGASGDCGAACCESHVAADSAHHACVFCRVSDAPREPLIVGPAADCDGCAVCHLLNEYQSVTPHELAPLAIELAVGQAAIRRDNALVAAAIRLGLSRGPPVA